jgi:hypothetical protein
MILSWERKTSFSQEFVVLINPLLTLTEHGSLHSRGLCMISVAVANSSVPYNLPDGLPRTFIRTSQHRSSALSPIRRSEGQSFEIAR